MTLTDKEKLKAISKLIGDINFEYEKNLSESKYDKEANSMISGCETALHLEKGEMMNYVFILDHPMSVLSRIREILEK